MGSFSAKVNVAVVGVTGYSGLELTRLVLAHPRAQLVGCYSTRAAFPLGELLPGHSQARALTVEPVASLLNLSSPPAWVFLATPAEVSMKLAPQLLERGINVIDLSGAFRLNEDFRAFYHCEHTSPEWVSRAHYGLYPWAKLSAKLCQHGPVLIANPGCYATAALQGLIPLVKNHLVAIDSLVIDAKSGATGAGKKVSENQLFSEVEGDCLPYKVGEHQHLPEIRRFVKAFSGVAIDPMFTTHLLPTRRGLSAAIYARLSAQLEALPSEQREIRVAEALKNAYHDDPLTVVTSIEESHGRHLSLRKAVGSSRTFISYTLKDNKLFVFSVIDNLQKGAGAQAVQNFNCLHDWPSSLGLELETGVI